MGGKRKKDRKIGKKTEKQHFKPLSTISLPCMKIQGDHGPLPPAADTYGLVYRLRGERSNY